jgi:peptidoglycan/LPS O-acetylase OafA/YrhL
LPQTGKDLPLCDHGHALMNPGEPTQESAPRPIPALTTLRFFAALLVVLFHHGQGLVAEMPGWCQVIVRGGYVGVPFFFVLSGFILAYNYLPAARRGTLGNGRCFFEGRSDRDRRC